MSKKIFSPREAAVGGSLLKAVDDAAASMVRIALKIVLYMAGKKVVLIVDESRPFSSLL